MVSQLLRCFGPVTLPSTDNHVDAIDCVVKSSQLPGSGGEGLVSGS